MPIPHLERAEHGLPDVRRRIRRRKRPYPHARHLHPGRGVRVPRERQAPLPGEAALCGCEEPLPLMVKPLSLMVKLEPTFFFFIIFIFLFLFLSFGVGAVLRGRSGFFLCFLSLGAGKPASIVPFARVVACVLSRRRGHPVGDKLVLHKWVHSLSLDAHVRGVGPEGEQRLSRTELDPDPHVKPGRRVRRQGEDVADLDVQDAWDVLLVREHPLLQRIHLGASGPLLELDQHDVRDLILAG
mmetsp:Transcript_60579/g.143523  ORF Transcript_60579/g.143523 Transcript_60579/m.143523 type:complete len:241 (+) Transcript_60579:508-1230(+)